ncbi:hypothetical protein Y013_23885 [Rhodococcus pyridinivorans SB3094]|uniref:Uncharacterized protein n=1 Tax=Rhodococcus pyridinivorans SB3094 TaxID=1435356 RepID=V9XNJ0_9NOCA|nr:hypothetical protein Y013_23885 [Rhodococcus pyridinivorans SB3094]
MTRYRVIFLLDSRAPSMGSIDDRRVGWSVVIKLVLTTGQSV